jgi:Lrp/AsnC family transcriptional regulator for asnA, asnC and gidA
MSRHMELDETDREILRILQEDARTPFSEIARRIDMSSATVHDRVGRLEEAGVIEGYHAKVDPQAVGLGTTALVGLRVDQGDEREKLEELSKLDRVREVYLTTGEWDVMIRVYAEDNDSLRDLIFEHIGAMDGFTRSQTMVILGTETDKPGVPI